VATDGTSFEIDIDVPAGSAASAAEIVDTLAARLKAASDAASSAADAVKAGEAAYKQAENAADRAAKAVEKVNVAMQTADGAQLEKLKARQVEAAAAADKARAALVGEATALDKLKAAASGAAASQDKLTKELEGAQKAAEFEKASRGTGNLGKLSGALNQLGGPLGKVGGFATGAADAISDLTETVGKAGPYVALGIAVVALATAIISATVAATAYAVSMAQAARSQMLLSDGIAGSVEHGRDLDAAIKSLEKRVPQTSEELRNMAADLAKTGLKGKDLADALEESATKAAEMKWGPDFARGVNSTDKLVSRLKANVTELFAGPRIQGALDKFLDALGSLVDLFDENTVTGQAMKVVAEDIFGTLIDGATSVIPKVIAGFIQLQIWILKALIAIKPYGSEIRTVIEAMAVFAAVVVGVVVGAIAAVVAVGALFVAGLVAIRDGVAAATEAIVRFVTDGINLLRGMNLNEIGTSIIQGLVSGIAGGGPAVVNALTGVVSGAIGAAKKALGIASPSKVFAEIGMNTAEGMAGGVDEGAGQVQGSLESMVAPPAESAAAAPAAASSGGGSNFSGAQFIFNGVQGAEDAVSRIEEMLLRFIEGDVAQTGAAVPNA
jgi:hypothetical protein